MSDYRRIFIPGGCYFFTVVTYQRRPVFALPENIELLRGAFKRVMAQKPFQIDAIVILPDHCHCIGDYPKTTRIFLDVGAKSRNTFPNASARTASAPAKRVFGNAVFGTTSFATKTIGGGTWIIFITIQSNTGWRHRPSKGGRGRVVRRYLGRERSTGFGS
nr:transposase [Methylomonas sp. LL1]